MKHLKRKFDWNKFFIEKKIKTVADAARIFDRQYHTVQYWIDDGYIPWKVAADCEIPLKKFYLDKLVIYQDNKKRKIKNAVYFNWGKFLEDKKANNAREISEIFDCSYATVRTWMKRSYINQSYLENYIRNTGDELYEYRRAKHENARVD